MRMKDVVGVVLGLASLAAFSATQLFAQADAARGDTANRPAERQGAPEQARHNRAFLGVGVENASAALASHLALPEGEGLVVEHVAANSPAAKAGIEQHDVLLRVGDQKLLSAEQFVKLIHSQKPGEKCSMELMRQGKKENVEVTLGEEPAAMSQGTHAGHMRMHELNNGTGTARHERRGPEWERFDSLSLQKIGKNEFKASISYLDNQGKVERHEFQGTPAEIHHALAGEKGVPRSEREHLYRALNMSESGSLPGVRLVPGEGLVIDFGSLMPDQSGQQQSAGQEF